ncbi:MAG: DNA mismatch repair endonuclease MutL [Brockia lithotrophica]|nr:DNA mismatch repair endonuclease MutL [Brockia lithotrophica]
MGKIRVLPPEVIGHIAAGEVVERPASVAKELVENSLDAGARRVVVAYEGGGIALVRVRDDGEGISAEDLPQVFVRHATSKIARAEDLARVTTLGFRGEALPSIAAVARVRIASRTPYAPVASWIAVEGGEVVGRGEEARAPGTEVVVRDLFFNTPARRKFVRSLVAEGAHLLEVLERLALSRPDVAFAVYGGDRLAFATPGDGAFGTAVEVRDLFFNTPARLKFLKSGKTEIGLENPGVREALDLVERLPEGVVLVASLFGSTEDEYVAVAEAFSRSPRVAALELNLSCPNVAEGGLTFGRNPEGVARVTARVRAATSLPLWVKLSPDTCDVVAAAKAAHAAGADALVLGNTMPGLALDRRTYTPVLANVTGGLSGPALKPIALRLVYEVYQHVPLPIVGVGGISDAGDVLEFLAAGASAVQIGTAALRDPFVFERILEELPAALLAAGVDRAASFSPSGCLFSGRRAGGVGRLRRRRCEHRASAVFRRRFGGSSGKPASRLRGPFAFLVKGRRLGSEGGASPSGGKEVSSAVGGLSAGGEEPPRAREPRGKYDAGLSEVAPLVPLLQLFDTYILAAGEEEYYLVDQHAAQERIRYEKLLRAAADGTPSVHFLVVPWVLERSASEAEALAAQLGALREMGIDISPFGPRRFRVRAVPDWLADEETFLAFLERFLGEGGRLGRLEFLDEFLKDRACKAAIKGNRRLSPEEMSGLLAELFRCSEPYTCPHGRPTIVRIGREDLERLFRRTVL